jgi:hypothetical protein
MATREALERQAELTSFLAGAVCSQVSIGADEALIIDFGELRETLDGQLAGSLVLVIECPWRIDAPEVPVVGWEDDEEDVAHLATVLIGATVEGLDVRRPGFDLSIDFSNQHRLRVFPDCRAYYHDELAGAALPWQLAGPAIPIAAHSGAIGDVP